VSLLVAILLLGAGAATVWVLNRPIHLIVDGRPQTVPAGSTIADIRAANLLTASPGALLSVKGKVIKPTGGESPSVRRNGALATPTQRVRQGDELVSVIGVNVTERTVTATESVPPAVEDRGSGPVMKVAETGTPGVAEVTKGQVSGDKVSSRVIKQGKPMVIQRSRPTSGDKLVALTFDDGPWPGQTDKILDILAQKRIKATFFMLGGRVKGSPELARRVRDEGHLIGNHTLGHKELTKESPAEIRRQIRAGAEAIKSATGVDPVWFRPPFGAVNAKVFQQMRSLKLRVAMWDIDTLDWTRPGVPRIVNSVVKHAEPGAVILMHDGGEHHEQTVAAVPLIIDKLQAQGYTFVTLEELAAAK
jgi:peptidoglycan/xylan/chitin deacetylase (PgdA/CDA1 family)